MPNAVVIPHASWLAPGLLKTGDQNLLRHLRRHLKGKALLNAVDKQREA